MLYESHPVNTLCDAGIVYLKLIYTSLIFQHKVFALLYIRLTILFCTNQYLNSYAALIFCNKQLYQLQINSTKPLFCNRI